MALIVIDNEDYDIIEKYDRKPTDEEIRLSAKLINRIQSEIDTSINPQLIMPSIAFVESSILPECINMIPYITEDVNKIMKGVVVESSFTKVSKFLKNIVNIFGDDEENK